jgi:hypothetical protein
MGLLVAALVAMIAGPIVPGQTTAATLSGMIRDTSGAVIPDAKIGNTLEEPGFSTVDLRSAREVRFNERVTAEFSVDFFNLFNRTNITDLNTVYGGIDLNLAPNPILRSGTPRDASNPFQVQYGLKLRF